MSQFLLVIDQGTTSTRAIVFDGGTVQVVGMAQQAFEQMFPHNGWVEHCPKTIWRDTVTVCHDVLSRCEIRPEQVVAMGITNQRETTVVWDKNTGEAVYNAIVWQDRRTADVCRQLEGQGLAQTIKQKTGLLLDPYFSATKLKWILDNVDGVRHRAEQGELAFGTIDSFLLWHLTVGKVHATDATNAARTMLFNIHSQDWDEELLQIFDIPPAMLPVVKDSSDDFGHSAPAVLGASIPIGGIAGDQQAAMVGQACFEPGMMKSTYGTGAFLLLNTGQSAVDSQHRLLTTVAYRLKGQVSYALEGSIFIAGAAMQWLRDKLHLWQQAQESEALASSIDSTEGVYFIPAFTGLGAPYWQPDVRGALFGLTRDSGIAHITRAALEAVCYQTRDVLDCMLADGAKSLQSVRVDGGMVQNSWLCQCLADVLQIPVERPNIIETTALGAAFLAGLQVGVFASLADISRHWQQQKQFVPAEEKYEEEYANWQHLVRHLVAMVPKKEKQ